MSSPHSTIPLRQLKSYEAELLFVSMGYTFDLENPQAANPILIVKQNGVVLPPGVRFSVMRDELNRLGLKYVGLSDMAYVAAARRHGLIGGDK